MTAMTMEDWIPLIVVYSMPMGILPTVTEAWILEESAGNPCAIGRPGAQDAQGHVLESGLAQLYSPDEIKIAKTTNAAMRVGCLRGTQWLTRTLSPSEKQEHVRAAVTFIRHCWDVATHCAITHTLKWDLSDRWRLSKLVHGLPDLVTLGIPAVCEELQRAPSSWMEFTNVVAGATLPHNVSRYAPYDAEFMNADRVGRAAPRSPMHDIIIGGEPNA